MNLDALIFAYSQIFFRRPDDSIKQNIWNYYWASGLPLASPNFLSINHTFESHTHTKGGGNPNPKFQEMEFSKKNVKRKWLNERN